jgi:hypothetical protein
MPWLQVFDAMQSTKKQHMALLQVVVTAAQFGFPIAQPRVETEVLCMLKFFTESGLLMHHNCPALRDIVVLDVVSCLVTPASIVMCQHDIHMLNCHETARATNNEAYLSLTTEGLLCDVLLDTLWCDCIDIKREVVELMLFYGLMVPMLEENGASSSQYLVPSLLPDQSHLPRAHDGGDMWRHTAPTAPANSALQARACGNYRAVAAARASLPCAQKQTSGGNESSKVQELQL